MQDFKENVIEWLSGDDTATIIFTQKNYISKFKKLANEFPELVKITAENRDGSICGHIYLPAIVLSHLSLKKKATFIDF